MKLEPLAFRLRNLHVLSYPRYHLMININLSPIVCHIKSEDKCFGWEKLLLISHIEMYPTPCARYKDIIDEEPINDL